MRNRPTGAILMNKMSARNMITYSFLQRFVTGQRNEFGKNDLSDQAGWKENHATFMNELKNLQAVGLTTLGQSLRTAFDLLNLNRLVTGIDNYGQGRNPFFLEPSIIVAITDGSKLTTANGVQDELHLPLNSPLPGSELTKEPFRWDQRLFALVLRLPGATAVEQEQPTAVQFDESPITAMCDVTGGRSYSVTSQRILNQCLESLVQKIQSGVVINFEKSGPDPPILEDGLTDPVRSVGSQPWHSCHKLIYVRPNPKTGVPIGHWPIPESFWPDQNSPTLPPRTSHPVVKFSCTDSEPLVIDKLPFDKYELEPSPLTQFILERKSPHTCWPVFVPNSAKYCELGHPFGYLKASTALNCVNLFVLPYNYPVLLPLLDDLFKMHKNKPPLKWRQPFENYLKTMPPYYIGPLKKALRMMGTPNLMPDSMEYGLSYSVVSYLKKLSQQAKVESDRVIGSIGKKYPQETSIKVRSGSNALSLALRKDFKQLLQEITGEVPQRPMDLNMKEFAGFQIALLNKDIKPQTFRNAYDIPRTNLLDHLTRMRANLLKSTRQFLKGQDEDQAHSIPIVQMGNYQEYLKHIPSPLRELDYDQPRRLHTFGNPFKLDKKGMMIDEADEFVSGNQNKLKRTGEPNMQGVPKRRRCMSPLLHSRPQSPSVINNHISGKDSPVSVNQVLCDLPKPVAVHKNTDMSNNVAINEATENHVADHLCDDLLITKSESFGTLPNAALEASESYAAGGDSNFSPNDTSDVLLDKTRESGDTESCLLNNNTAFVHRKRRLHQCRSYEEANIELKAQILKEIRKPGRKYGIIFTLLKDVQGDLQTRLLFLQHVIKEATRFKKRMLIEQLEGFLEEIHRRTNQVNHLSSC
ncbi:integrator complex subunit 6-B isoform X1 [Xenopus laevis]|uniref:Integrator complex subunit 6-B isoform X1 n=1 Tax=Xenopus laevis TaxID=8355 RepID=A0A8J1MC44_XENLA|nr:integrator complex subunit 6-B isoform X1 [Xenopus laevis]